MKHVYAALVFCLFATSALAFEPIRISRYEWGARPAKTRELTWDSGKTRFMIGHHGVTSTYRDINGDKAVARSIQSHAMSSGSADTPVHFMIGKNGTYLEGRDFRAAAACNYGYNQGSICAFFLGCYDDYTCHPANVVTNAMIFAMAQAIAESAYNLRMDDIGRHNIYGMSELGRSYPNNPGSRIMQPNATGFVQIDVIATLARKELARMRGGRDDL